MDLDLVCVGWKETTGGIDICKPLWSSNSTSKSVEVLETDIVCGSELGRVGLQDDWVTESGPGNCEEIDLGFELCERIGINTWGKEKDGVEEKVELCFCLQKEMRLRWISHP